MKRSITPSNFRYQPGAIELRGAMAQPVRRVEMLHRRFVVLEIVERLAEREVQDDQRESGHRPVRKRRCMSSISGRSASVSLRDDTRL